MRRRVRKSEHAAEHVTQLVMQPRARVGEHDAREVRAFERLLARFAIVQIRRETRNRMARRAEALLRRRGASRDPATRDQSASTACAIAFQRLVTVASLGKRDGERRIVDDERRARALVAPMSSSRPVGDAEDRRHLRARVRRRHRDDLRAALHARAPSRDRCADPPPNASTASAVDALELRAALRRRFRSATCSRAIATTPAARDPEPRGDCSRRRLARWRAHEQDAREARSATYLAERVRTRPRRRPRAPHLAASKTAPCIASGLACAASHSLRPTYARRNRMKLHFHPVSTASRPVIAFLAEAKIAYEPVVVDIMTGEHLKEPFLSLNPSGQVPVLEDGDFVLTESSAILKYLADKVNSPAYPKDLKARARINEAWTGSTRTTTASGATTSSTRRSSRTTSASPRKAKKATVEWGREKSEQWLKILDTNVLGKNKYLCGDADHDRRLLRRGDPLGRRPHRRELQALPERRSLDGDDARAAELEEGQRGASTASPLRSRGKKFVTIAVERDAFPETIPELLEQRASQLAGRVRGSSSKASRGRSAERRARGRPLRGRPRRARRRARAIASRSCSATARSALRVARREPARRDRGAAEPRAQAARARAALPADATARARRRRAPRARGAPCRIVEREHPAIALRRARARGRGAACRGPPRRRRRAHRDVRDDRRAEGGDADAPHVRAHGRGVSRGGSGSARRIACSSRCRSSTSTRRRTPRWARSARARALRCCRSSRRRASGRRRARARRDAGERASARWCTSSRRPSRRATDREHAMRICLHGARAARGAASRVRRALRREDDRRLRHCPRRRSARSGRATARRVTARWAGSASIRASARSTARASCATTGPTRPDGEAGELWLAEPRDDARLLGRPGSRRRKRSPAAGFTRAISSTRRDGVLHVRRAQEGGDPAARRERRGRARSRPCCSRTRACARRRRSACRRSSARTRSSRTSRRATGERSTPRRFARSGPRAARRLQGAVAHPRPRRAAADGDRARREAPPQVASSPRTISVAATIAWSFANATSRAGTSFRNRARRAARSAAEHVERAPNALGDDLRRLDVRIAEADDAEHDRLARELLQDRRDRGSAAPPRSRSTSAFAASSSGKNEYPFGRSWTMCA